METRNGLLARLPGEERVALEPLLEFVTLNQRDTLFEPHQPIPYVYFFNSGLSSEIAINPDGDRIEAGCIGREGLSGLPVVLGTDQTPHHSFMQIGGSAHRIRSEDLQPAMDRSPALRSHLLRYAHVFMIQIAATALADGRYSLEQRLARWLLMSHDRCDGDELPLTHEFLSLMLGVRRAGVTNALHVLEGELLIRAQRGLITVRDRRRLEERAAGSYGMPEAEYRRLFAGSGFEG